VAAIHPSHDRLRRKPAPRGRRLAARAVDRHVPRIKDDRLWVYGVGEDGVTAFTEDGIENLRQIIVDERTAGRAPPSIKPAKQSQRLRCSRMETFRPSSAALVSGPTLPRMPEPRTGDHGHANRPESGEFSSIKTGGQRSNLENGGGRPASGRDGRGSIRGSRARPIEHAIPPPEREKPSPISKLEMVDAAKQFDLGGLGCGRDGDFGAMSGSIATRAVLGWP